MARREPQPIGVPVGVGLAVKRAQQALDQGQLDAAIQIAQEVLDKHPKSAGALRVRGLAYARQGTWSHAIEALEPLATGPSPSIEVLLNLGVACVALERFREARRWFETMVGRNPESSVAHYNLGVVLASLGDVQGAEQCYTKEIALAGHRALGFANLGVLFGSLGRVKEARAVLERGMEAQPNNPEVRINLAQLDLTEGRVAEAAQGFEIYLRHRPDRHDVRANLGVAKMRMGALEEARAIFEHLRLKVPSDANVLHNLGLVLSELREPEAALPILEKAAQHGRNPETHRALFKTHHDLAQSTAAERVLGEGRIRFPQEPSLFVEACVGLPRIYRKQEEVIEHRGRFQRGLVDLEAAVERTSFDGQELLQVLDQRNNFGLAYQGENAVDLFRAYGDIHTRLAAKHHPLPAPTRRAGPKPRIGWISSHFIQHTIGKLCRGFIEMRSPGRHEIRILHLGRTTDSTSRAFLDAADAFIHLRDRLDGICRRILAEELDVLIFADVGMDSLSQALAARRLAPIQAAITGHPVTTGYPNMDYYLSVGMAEPPDGAEHYTETLMTLPGIGYPVPPFPRAPEVNRAYFGLPEGVPIFLSPQTLFKYLPQYDEVYARILEGTPEAHLVFISGRHAGLARAFEERLRDACRARGFEPNDRLHFVPWLSQEDFGRLHQVSDILLDSLPFSSYTSVLEAWSHVPIPIVTLEGRLLCERLGAGLARAAGLECLVAKTPDDFVELALRLAADLGERTKAKEMLSQNAPALFSNPSPVRALEDLVSAWT